MTEQFNKWWNKDDLTNDNLYRKDSPMYWAWEGWQAGVKAEREACAKVCDELAADAAKEQDFHALFAAESCADAIRESGAP